MDDLRANAHRLVELFEAMRRGKPGRALLRLNELNLSISHLRAMHLLATDRPLAMKALAEQLGMSPPSVTALTRRLAQAGLVERHSDPGDSRVVLLSLTEAGRDLLTALHEEHVRRMELLLQGLAPDEQRLFIDLLARAVQAMQVSAPAGPAMPEAGRAKTPETSGE